MSAVRYTRTSLLDSPSMATTSDAGSVPLRQSYSTGAEVQEADLGQSYDGYEQQQTAFTHSAADYPEPILDADAQLGSPLFLQQGRTSMQASHASHSIAPHSFSTSSPSQGQQSIMEQSAMQQYASDPSWSSMDGQDIAQYAQHPVEPVAMPGYLYYAPGHSVVEHRFENGINHPHMPYPGYLQQPLDQTYASPNPYPELPYVQPEHDQSYPQVWQHPSDDDSGGSGEGGYDGKLNTSYAHLIYMCLLEAPNHSRKLKEIYDWIRVRTNKADDLTTNGWQNSVRHNLSMNKVSFNPQERLPSDS